MHTSVLSPNRPAWTWADLFSTYRFWGLFLWFVLASAGVQLHYMYSYQYLDRMGIMPITRSTIMAVAQVAALPLALILAWVAIRTKPVVIMFCAGVLAAFAAFAFAARWPGGQAATAVLVLCVRLGSSVATLLFPTLIAGAIGGYESFVVAFGAAFLFQYGIGMNMLPVGAVLIHRFGLSAAGYACASLMLAAVIYLIPVKHALFTTEPPARGDAIAPQHREPFLAGLLTAVVPFYMLYWLYKAHGEAAHVRPSRTLLSPRGAAWVVAMVVLLPMLLTPLAVTLLTALASRHDSSSELGLMAVPLIALVVYSLILTTLADHLNLCAAESGMPRVCAPWGVFLATMLFSPVAIGILQAALNDLSERGAKPAPILAT